MILIKVLNSTNFGGNDTLKRLGHIIEAIILEQTDKAFSSHSNVNRMCAEKIITEFQLSPLDEFNCIIQYLTELKNTSLPLESVQNVFKKKAFGQ